MRCTSPNVGAFIALRRSLSAGMTPASRWVPLAGSTRLAIEIGILADHAGGIEPLQHVLAPLLPACRERPQAAYCRFDRLTQRFDIAGNDRRSTRGKFRRGVDLVGGDDGSLAGERLGKHDIEVLLLAREHEQIARLVERKLPFATHH